MATFDRDDDYEELAQMFHHMYLMNDDVNDINGTMNDDVTWVEVNDEHSSDRIQRLESDIKNLIEVVDILIKSVENLENKIDPDKSRENKGHRI